MRSVTRATEQGSLRVQGRPTRSSVLTSCSTCLHSTASWRLRRAALIAPLKHTRGSHLSILEADRQVLWCSEYFNLGAPSYLREFSRVIVGVVPQNFDGGNTDPGMDRCRRWSEELGCLSLHILGSIRWDRQREFANCAHPMKTTVSANKIRAKTYLATYIRCAAGQTMYVAVQEDDHGMPRVAAISPYPTPHDCDELRFREQLKRG